MEARNGELDVHVISCWAGVACTAGVVMGGLLCSPRRSIKENACCSGSTSSLVSVTMVGLSASASSFRIPERFRLFSVLPDLIV